MLRFTIAALLAVTISLSAGKANASKRVALVIGNDAYTGVAKLQKAVNDARTMAETLDGIGFRVMRVENVSRREMNRALLRFTSQLETGDEALFFFAGHGVEIAGRNYLLPTDVPVAKPGQEDFVTSEAIAVDKILDNIRRRGTRVSILVLDACRDNPFPRAGTRSLGGTRGFSRIAAPKGTFIMYSAGVGQAALDRLSDDDPHANSVFTRSLVPLLKQPGLSLTATARQVRRTVEKLAATVAHDQRPAYYDEVTGDFFFSGKERSKLPASAAPLPQSPAALAWAEVKSSNSEAVLEAFIKQFPNDVYAELARARLRELQEKKVAVGVYAERPAASADTQDHECDRLAAHPDDQNRVKGVDGVKFGKIDAVRAIAACEQARTSFPQVERFTLQLARAYSKAKNHIKAHALLLPLAERGNVLAMNSLGFAFETGEGVAKDHREAMRWYRMAADKGYALAMSNTGLMYANGKGVRRDDREAVRWLRKAAKAGESTAMANLGSMYDFGRGVAKNRTKAIEWFFKAADKGEASACFGLAYAHEAGSGVAKNRRIAAEFMLRSVRGAYSLAKKEMLTNAKAWSSDFRREFQRLMKDEGIYDGAIDGQFGPATKRAIEALAGRS